MIDMTTSKPYIFDLDLSELENLLTSWGEPKYRAKQVWQGLYIHLWDHPEQFTNLPKPLRKKLAELMEFSRLTAQDFLKSKDGETVKTLFILPDQNAIEAVIMHYDERKTLCISSQVGCAMGCVFCATGQMGFKRNLSSGEIIEQVIYYARQLRQSGDSVTNVVLMGMGEPFHNYEAVMRAIEQLNHPEGLHLGARRFTISTVGIIPAIRRFTAEQRQINLAISLHSVTDEQRSAIIPVNRKYPVAELIAACRDYTAQTRRRITFEWALIEGVNDTPQIAGELGALLRGILCHVNVIPLNPTHKYRGKGSTRERAEAFKTALEKAGIPCTVRMRRGIDIQAGCGQLAALSNG